jgi:membrane protease YdiL (CAAX protease family)
MSIFSLIGLIQPVSWLNTLLLAIGWLILMLNYSPIADRLASKFFSTPPNLKTFNKLQKSKWNLIIGIVIAWILGGFIEEIGIRGIVLKFISSLVMNFVTPFLGNIIAITGAALTATLFHYYQGTKAMSIIFQLSVLFGLLYVVSGYNLWSVIICHGLYDTIAFIKFANKSSKYSQSI